MIRLSSDRGSTGNLHDEVRRLRRMLQTGNIRSVLLGLSGGPDSVCAFHLLRLASTEIPGFRLAIGHANFNLRGEESLRDETFVRDLVARYPETEAHFTSFDTGEYCRQHRLSIEMGARDLRHGWFRKLCTENGIDRIVTGHNADDNEETLLLNLLRGSGTRGLRGMEEDTGRIIRPLLHLNRKQILSLIDALPEADRGVPSFITDSTNLTEDYRRNFLRHRVIPLLENRWEGVHTALQTTIRLQQEENKVVEHAVNEALAGIPADLLPWDTLLRFPSPLTLVQRWSVPIGGNPRLASEIVSLIQTSTKGVPPIGKRWALTGDLEIITTPEGLKVSKSEIQEQLNLTLPEVSRSVIEVSNSEAILEMVRKGDAYTVYLPDADYYWRTIEKGDRIRIGQHARKLVSDVLKEAKVPLSSRGSVQMLCRRTDNIPVWIPGIRRSFDNAVTGKEKFIIRLEYLPRNK